MLRRRTFLLRSPSYNVSMSYPPCYNLARLCSATHIMTSHSFVSNAMTPHLTFRQLRYDVILSDLRRSKKSRSKIRKIRRQNRNMIKGLQDPTSKSFCHAPVPPESHDKASIYDPGSSGSHCENENSISMISRIPRWIKNRIQDPQDPRFPGFQDRTKFKSPRSAESHNKMNVQGT